MKVGQLFLLLSKIGSASCQPQRGQRSGSAFQRDWRKFKNDPKKKIVSDNSFKPEMLSRAILLCLYTPGREAKLYSTSLLCCHNSCAQPPQWDNSLPRDKTTRATEFFGCLESPMRKGFVLCTRVSLTVRDGRQQRLWAAAKVKLKNAWNTFKANALSKFV